MITWTTLIIACLFCFIIGMLVALSFTTGGRGGRW